MHTLLAVLSLSTKLILPRVSDIRIMFRRLKFHQHTNSSAVFLPCLHPPPILSVETTNVAALKAGLVRGRVEYRPYSFVERLTHLVIPLQRLHGYALHLHIVCEVSSKLKPKRSIEIEVVSIPVDTARRVHVP